MMIRKNFISSRRREKRGNLAIVNHVKRLRKRASREAQFPDALSLIVIAPPAVPFAAGKTKHGNFSTNFKM
jgi:hypothetical protein